MRIAEAVGQRNPGTAERRKCGATDIRIPREKEKHDRPFCAAKESSFEISNFKFNISNLKS
jgi:hypothetical protein